jgi:hypothetical protein
MTAPKDPYAGDQWLSDISSGLGVYSGLQRGGSKGDVQAGFGAAKLASNAGLFSQGANNSVGELSNLYGIYSGIQKGGVGGYGSAAVNAGQLAERLGVISSTGPLGATIPVLGAALSIYSFADNWQSGKTGSDALQGAQAGAAIGSIVPGVGTALGAVVGAAVGALSSLFGPGATDPEQATFGNYLAAYNGGAAAAARASQPPGAEQGAFRGFKFGADMADPNAPKLNFNSMDEARSAGGAAAVAHATPAQTFQVLAGIFDMRSSDLPFYQQYGRMGESAFTVDMATQINQALAKGVIGPHDSAQTIYDKVVNPWIGNMANSGANGGKGWATISAGNPDDINIAETQPAVKNLITQMIGQYQSGQLNAQTKVSRGGQDSITNLPAFGAAGYSGATQKAQQTVQQNIAPLQEAALSMPGVTGSSASSMLPLMLAMPALFGGANVMADPNNPAGGSSVSDPNTAAQIGAGTAPSGNNFLSDLGSFLSGPGGTALEAGALAGVGLSETNTQKGQNDTLASGLKTAGQPFTAAGAGELSQITGGPQMGGALGKSIADQTAAASNLAAVAKADTTGNLTPAQQSQVQDFIKQQRAMIDTQLAASGTSDSSARSAAYQQIDDNAAKLTQSLTEGNIATGTAALNAVQTTYSNLLNQALSSSEFGFSTELAAVQTQIQADTALAASLNQLFAGIAQGYGNATAGGKTTGGTTAGKAVGSALSSVASAVKGVASSVSGGGGSGMTPDQIQQDINQQGQENILAGQAIQAGDTAAANTTGLDSYIQSQVPDPTSIDLSQSTDFSSDPWSGGDFSAGP